ncbi:MAG: permease-like cell division protein FtsX [Actinomycetota bacterium]|nr:permease-like cell division protein FtsX [Actinomycetota bacterium]
MAISFSYFARESVQNFRRNWVMSLGAVITIYLSLLLVGVSIAVGVIATEIVKSVEDKVTVQIFLADGASTEDVGALQAWVKSDALVSTVEYTSKDDALKKFKETNSESPELFEQIETNPLPASLDVTLKDPRQVEVLVTKIKASELFLKVADRPDRPEGSLKYGQQVVDKLFAATRVIRTVLIVFIAMLAIVSLIFINNTIRLAIYARRKEIGIMRLVGASNWFIRTPFLLEGMIQSLIGALLAILTVVAIQAAVIPKLREAITFLPVDLASGTMVQLSLILVVSGVLIGLAGAGLALRRYLKV